MIEALPYPNEERRLSSLRSLNLLDTPIEERFERITRMVCRLLDVPIAIFNLLESNRQHYKSVQGLNVTDAPLEGAFCTHAILEEDMLLIPDAARDRRFHDNPFVTGKYLNIGLYAGCPVRAPDGMPVGTLCAIDTKPRDLSAEQLGALKDLASMLETELKLANLTTHQKKLAEELDNAQRLALIDPLTRLWNRNGIFTIIEREWSDAVRNNRPLALVMADIDHFKNINDEYGHPAGDEVIRCAGKCLLEMLRAEDAVGRVGGEEFLMLLTNPELDCVQDVVERIRAAMESRKIEPSGKTIPVTMSFGIAPVFPDQKIKIRDAVEMADQALYQAKRSGRNKVVLYRDNS